MAEVAFVESPFFSSMVNRPLLAAEGKRACDHRYIGQYPDFPTSPCHHSHENGIPDIYYLAVNKTYDLGKACVDVVDPELSTPRPAVWAPIP